MITESKPSRRVFIAAAAATVTAVGAYAAKQHFAEMLGNASEDGTVSLVDRYDMRPPVIDDTSQVWRAAIDTSVRIGGEHGLIDGRIVSVADGAMGGVRPSGLRPEALIVYFETAVPYAPDGNRTYSIDSVVNSTRELFLTRGEDVFDKAILMAVLN